MTPEQKTGLAAGAGLVLLAALLVLVLPLCVHVVGCTPQARSAADAIALDLTQAVCSPADPFDTTPVVEVICTALESAEAVAAITETTLAALADGGPPPPVPMAVHMKLPRAQAAELVARHPRRTDGGGGP